MAEAENEPVDILDNFDQEVENMMRQTADSPTLAVGDLSCDLRSLHDINQLLQRCLPVVIQTLRDQLSANMAQQESYMDSCLENDKIILIKPLHVFAAPYFRDARGFNPPLNEDAIERKEQKHVNHYLTPPLPWTKVERTAFIDIVRKNGREVLLKPVKLRLEFLVEKRKRKFLRVSELEQILVEISEIRKTIDLQKRVPFEHLWKEQNIELDWLSISSGLQKKGFERDAEACELMWINCLRPDINRSRFLPEEDLALEQIAEAHEERDWISIARTLDTNRTALQCFERYQSTINKTLIKKFWTEEEDTKLIEAVESCKIGEFIPWKKVVHYMHGWSMPQLQNRWDRCLKPQNRGGHWTPEEDAILLLAVPCLGRRWTLICQLLHGRSSYVSRERYTNALDPSLCTGYWTWEEDKLLLSLLAVHGERWGAVSRFLEGRTDNMVNQRASVLKRYKPDLYEKVLNLNGENIASILPKKQFARSNKCRDINFKRESNRQNAFSLAVDAVQTVFGNAFDALACKSFNELAVKLNTSTLKKVAKVLLPECPSEAIKRPIARYTSERHRKSDSIDTDESDEEWESDSNKDEEDDEVEDGEQEEVCNEIVATKETMTEEELEQLDNEFENCVLPAAVIGSKYLDTTRMVVTKKMQVEYNAMLKYFLNAFKCRRKRRAQTQDGQEDDSSDEELIFRRVDFGKTVSIVMDTCVLAVCDKGQIPIIPPNTSTIDSYIIMLLTRNNIPSLLDQLDPKILVTLSLLINDQETHEQHMVNGCPMCKAIQEKSAAEGDLNEPGPSNASIVCDKCNDENLADNLLGLLMYRYFAAFAFPNRLARIEPSKHQLKKFVVQNPGRHVHHYHRHKEGRDRGIKRVYYSDSSSEDED